MRLARPPGGTCRGESENMTHATGQPVGATPGLKNCIAIVRFLAI